MNRFWLRKLTLLCCEWDLQSTLNIIKSMIKSNEPFVVCFYTVVSYLLLYMLNIIHTGHTGLNNSGMKAKTA